MPTNTTNFSLLKPLPNDPTDEDLWGGYLNTNFDSIDSLLKVARDSLHRDVTTTDTVVSSDRNKTILADATAGAFTITLPAAASVGDGFKVAFVKSDAGGNAVTIEGDGSETINGQANYVLSGQGEAVFLVTDGAAWFSIGARQNPSAVPNASTTTPGIVELATDAETQAGTDSARAVVPSGMKAALGFSRFFESAEQSIPTNSNVTISHGLPSIPFLVTTHMICRTSELGYAVGDSITISESLSTTSSTNRGITTSYNATNIRLSASDALPTVIPAGGGGRANITPSSWRLVVRAWA